MNISEFAAIAGVSKATVSRYFNNGYLSDKKRIQTGWHFCTTDTITAAAEK